MYTKWISIFRDRLKVNRFVIAGLAFLVWMTFFDKGRWPIQLKLNSVVNDLQQECEDYKVKIEQAKSDKLDLENNLEKYAREKYYMHKPGEQVYIIEKK